MTRQTNHLRLSQRKKVFMHAISTNATVNERRGREAARPENLERSLSFEQMVTLTAKEQFGWSVAFVRRPLFMQPEVVIISPDKTEYVLIAEDGTEKIFFNVRSTDFD